MRPQTAAPVFGSAEEDFVELLPIVGHDVLHVSRVLQPALYLQAAGPGIEQGFQVAGAVHIPKRQQMFLFQQHAFLLLLAPHPLPLYQVERQAAELGTLAAVGRTPETVFGGKATSVVADTNGSMYEHFQAHLRHLFVYLPHLVEGEFPGQHHLPESQIAEPGHLCGGLVVHLR